ncbi:hypothetical protein AB0J86_12145 [Micromonospora sp. NPDC049559]|uniref:hypothetical protein n=1 Tax=Micromonospora sp. NPDC049559 TaxID=3155923 RepID=UPI003427CEC2
MALVGVHFVGGPADGTVRDLPAGPDGAPPPRWVVAERDAGTGAERDHLYRRDAVPDDGGGWTMRWVRTDAVGMTE